ncbi:Cloroperoxidase [Panus rudis PR-1116 ss-1]|nr:Cloroperoxidase [Panus rudis PR-1116 ss-1]
MGGESFFAIATLRVLSGLWSSVVNLFTNIVVFSCDFGLTLWNLCSPKLHANKVVPQGYPGANGLWPEYVPAQEGDSRCSCPALNAMANHGILPHDGKNISFRELNDAIRKTYNFAPTFCFFVPNNIATILTRNYWTDKFDLSDIDVHNGIEHDASLTREDSVHEPDQGKPSVPLIEELLASGTGPSGDLTPADLARLLGKRRIEAKAKNPKFSLSFNHKLFGSSNASTMLTILGGRVQDLRPWLLEERIPDKWQPRILSPMGLTFAEFNSTVFRVELGIKEELPPALASALGDHDTASLKGKKAA